MLQAMFNGVSAIGATQQDMDIIGNNIANVSTTAYKSSNATFANQLTQTIQGASSSNGKVGGTNPQQTGTGVRIASIDTLLNQGSLLSTSAGTDLAIQGNGYFMLSNPHSGVSYTRDGHFAVDNTGSLVDATTGEYVLGWSADANGVVNNGSAISQSSKLNIAVGRTTAVAATSKIAWEGNLSADDAGGATQTGTEVVYDSLGEPHNLTITLQRGTGNGGAATNSWTWTASGDPGLAAVNANTAVNTGTISFDGNGNVLSSTGNVVLNPTNGASQAQTIAMNYKDVTQDAGTSTFGAQNQDGSTTGSLQSFTIDQNGTITGSFSNGLTRSLGQIAMAGFNNPQGLNSVGNNEYSPTADSGEALVGEANTLGLGSISTGYLEQSNVDLGTELTNMIVAQRAFEANTKVVTAVDQMLTTLVQMKQ